MSMPKSEAEVTSPCIRQCCLDNNEICVGCYRSLDEIVSWQAYSTQVKKQVIQLCETRRNKHHLGRKLL